MLTIEKIGESELEQKLLTLASWDNGIRMDVMVFVHFFLTVIQGFNPSRFDRPR